MKPSSPEGISENFRNRRVALIGAPTDIGAGHRGGSMGPEALRVAGIQHALASLGIHVIDQGNVSGPPNPVLPPKDGYRHLDEAVFWCERVRDAIYDSMKAGDFPVMLGGDHALAIGSVAGVSRYCAERNKPLVVFWLDAHADFNTPDSSPSGNIHGMPAAVLAGYGHPKLLNIGHTRPVLDASRIVQIGIRSVDAVEKIKVREGGVRVFDMRQVDEIGMRAVMEKALNFARAENAHLHVSFDVDFLDPMIAPGVGTTVSGGPNYREAQLCMEMIYDSGLLGSLDIVELNPAFDLHNKTAELAVELVESLFGKQILARNPARPLPTY
ncbi:MAG: arginase [Oligoflexia bacterium]|nr:arginase [Oligoflexia bacterium]